MNAIHFLYRRAMTKIFLECRLSPSVFGLAAIWNSSLHNYYSPKAKFQPNNLEHAFRLFHRCLTVITWSVFKTSITVLNVSRKSALPWTLKIPEKKWNLPCIYHIPLSQLRSGQWRCQVQQNYADGIEGLIAPLVPRSVHERNPLQLQSFWTIITHVLSCLFQLDLKLISSLQITAIWTMSYLIRGKSSVPGARPRPFPIRWLFDARKTHLQPIAKCSRSYNSKENAHPKFSVIDVHSNADGIIVYSKANGLGVHSKVTVRIRPKPSAPHAVIFDLDTSHPAKASITMYVL